MSFLLKWNFLVYQLCYKQLYFLWQKHLHCTSTDITGFAKHVFHSYEWAKVKIIFQRFLMLDKKAFMSQSSLYCKNEREWKNISDLWTPTLFRLTAICLQLTADGHWLLQFTKTVSIVIVGMVTCGHLLTWLCLKVHVVSSKTTCGYCIPGMYFQFHVSSKQNNTDSRKFIGDNGSIAFKFSSKQRARTPK